MFSPSSTPRNITINITISLPCNQVASSLRPQVQDQVIVPPQQQLPHDHNTAQQRNEGGGTNQSNGVAQSLHSTGLNVWLQQQQQEQDQQQQQMQERSNWSETSLGFDVDSLGSAQEQQQIQSADYHPTAIGTDRRGTDDDDDACSLGGVVFLEELVITADNFVDRYQGGAGIVNTHNQDTCLELDVNQQRNGPDVECLANDFAALRQSQVVTLQQADDNVQHAQQLLEAALRQRQAARRAAYQEPFEQAHMSGNRRDREIGDNDYDNHNGPQDQ